jgi:hypothetical protein
LEVLVIIAESLLDISDHASLSLKPRIARVPLPEIDTNISLFRTFTDPSEVNIETVEIDYGLMSKLVAILFCSPDSRFGREEILPFLEYFNLRTDENVDVYCAGYGSGVKPDSYPDGRIVPNVAGDNWWFHVKPFNNIRLELEARTRWTYSGETDLILLTARRNLSDEFCLSFSQSLACNLERMVKDEAISSARSFMEDISRLAEGYNGTDSVARLSDQQGVKIGINAIKEAVLTVLPEKVRKEYRKAEHFALRSISR